VNLQNQNPQNLTQNINFSEQKTFEQKNDEFEKLLHSLHSQGIPRQTPIPDQLPQTYNILNKIHTDFQHLHGLLSFYPNTGHETTTTTTTTTAQSVLHSEKVMTKKMTKNEQKNAQNNSNLEILRSHVLVPNSRPFNPNLLETRQTPLHRLQLQQLHSQYITSAMGGELEGDFGDESDDEKNNENNNENNNEKNNNEQYDIAIKTKQRQDVLDNVSIPKEMFELFNAQTANDLALTLDNFNKNLIFVLQKIDKIKILSIKKKDNFNDNFDDEKKLFFIKLQNEFFNNVFAQFLFPKVHTNVNNNMSNDVALGEIDHIDLHNQQKHYQAQLDMMNEGDFFRGVG
jgi:hypothetical protein